MKRLARVSLLFSMLAAVATGTVYAADSRVATDTPRGQNTFWQGYSADMSDREYRNTYRANKNHVSKFIASYSENALLSLGIPRGGINLMGAAAGLAIKQDASIYLDKNHFLVLDLKDVSEDNRAVTFGIKFKW